MSRTVLVTGGTSGIGRAVAERFVMEGAHVLLTGRNPETAAEVAQEVGAVGIGCDATDPDQVAALGTALDRASAEGALDVLVNAAGGLVPEGEDDHPLRRVRAHWQAQLELNLLSAVLTTEAVRGRLRSPGAVVSIGSIGAERRGGSYGAAKAALGAWSAALSAELAPHGVTCNTVSPGYVGQTGFFGGGLTPQREAALVAETHNGRAGTPQDIAETVYFLSSPGARHLTGQTVHVNGGAHTTR
ncbi:SDR family NAD(P)-dependent oxidoreductase [Streptomyces sp. NPDC059740]|uniref:SDR family NAD(P)-dependent oxidoreductase n=1 Tax=Streptomyces sp. NPDC059740 TaxID=3346926 RepID=UPI00364F024E